MALVLTISLAEKPLTGEPDAGNPPVRFGGRGGANHAAPTPIDGGVCRLRRANSLKPVWSRRASNREAFRPRRAFVRDRCPAPGRRLTIYLTTRSWECGD